MAEVPIDHNGKTQHFEFPNGDPDPLLTQAKSKPMTSVEYSVPGMFTTGVTVPRANGSDGNVATMAFWICRLRMWTFFYDLFVFPYNWNVGRVVSRFQAGGQEGNPPSPPLHL